MTDNVENFKLERLSNQEIFAHLKKFNLQVGPVTDTTRMLYERRLQKHLDQLMTQSMDLNEGAEQNMANSKDYSSLTKKRKMENN